MSDLVQRLHEAACSTGDGYMADLLREAVDALGAAREDAERYRWLRDNNGVRNHHGVEVFIDDEAHAPGHLDAQVDAARKEEGNG